MKYESKFLFSWDVWKSTGHRPVTRGGEASLGNIFAPTGKMCWTYFETIGHSLKICPPLRKLFTPLVWCPKLVRGLEVQQTFSFPFPC